MAGTGTAYPADAVTGSPTYAALQGRNAFSAAMGGATSSRPLGGITGVRPGTPSNTITATSTTWTMNPNGFAGYIDLESSVTNSGYFFAFSGSITGAVTAAGGSARTDIVWVKIDDSNTSDGSSGAPRVELDYTANTTTPPARAFTVAQINVPASGGGSPTVTWVAPYTAAAGGIVACTSSATYPTAASYPGLYIDDLSTGTLLRSNGTSWLTIGGLAPYVSLGMTAAQNAAGSGLNTAVPWDLERSDTPGWHDPAVNPSRITVQRAGRYRVTASVTITSTTAGHYASGDIAVNGVPVTYTTTVVPAVSGVNYPTYLMTVNLSLSSGDYVEVRISDASATAIMVARSFFQLEYVGSA